MSHPSDRQNVSVSERVQVMIACLSRGKKTETRRQEQPPGVMGWFGRRQKKKGKKKVQHWFEFSFCHSSEGRRREGHAFYRLSVLLLRNFLSPASYELCASVHSPPEPEEYERDKKNKDKDKKGEWIRVFWIWQSNIQNKGNGYHLYRKSGALSITDERTFEESHCRRSVVRGVCLTAR